MVRTEKGDYLRSLDVIEGAVVGTLVGVVIGLLVALTGSKFGRPSVGRDV